MPPRFLQLSDVAEILAISARQAYVLVNSGELPAIRVGGRGQWRIENTELEAYIQRKYAETRALVESRPEGARTEDDDLEIDLAAAPGTGTGPGKDVDPAPEGQAS